MRALLVPLAFASLPIPSAARHPPPPASRPRPRGALSSHQRAARGGGRPAEKRRPRPGAGTRVTRGGGARVRRARLPARVRVRVRVRVRAYGVEAAAAPPPRPPVGGAGRGAGRGGVRGGGAAPPRRRVPLLPVAAAKRRRCQWRRLPCLPASEPAVPGTRFLRFWVPRGSVLGSSMVKPGHPARRRFRHPSSLLNARLLFFSSPFCFSEQLNKPAEVRRNVIGAVDFAVPVSAESRVCLFPRSGELSHHFAEFRDGWFAERREQAW